jgi:hypothetical protein
MTVWLAHSFQIVLALDICSVLIRAFHPIGRREISMKETITGSIVTVIYGALIGLTIGITDAFLNVPII